MSIRVGKTFSFERGELVHVSKDSAEEISASSTGEHPGSLPSSGQYTSQFGLSSLSFRICPSGSESIPSQVVYEKSVRPATAAEVEMYLALVEMERLLENARLGRLD